MAAQEGKGLRTLDGHAFKPLVHAALVWLRQHQAEINALNVFPVPDGDTGTNMMLTMTSAWEEIAEADEGHIGHLLGKMAHGALMGARGNSGVILSQIWRGCARSVDGKAEVNVADLAAAMHAAAETAYKGVVKPVEGTILTVVREVAEESSAYASDGQDVVALMEAMVKRARESVERTPTLLPVLRQAGVVDSGGQGLFTILEGMWRQLVGLPVVAVDRAVVPAIIPAHPAGEIEFDPAYPYDVQFLILGQNLEVERIRGDVEALGDCALTVGDPTSIRIHVHVADPGVPISYGVRQGALQDVVVENMQLQYEVFLAERQSQAEPVRVRIPVEEEPETISVVVVTAGAGLGRVFESLGAARVVEGGQTMNPSTADILSAIAGARSDEVIVLPNNKNILLAAQQAAEVSEKRVVVVPTQSIPQGISAMLALDQGGTLESNAAAMIESAKSVITGGITWSIRDVHINGLSVRQGDAIGLLDDELVVAATSYEEAVNWLLAEADIDERELVTLYYGEAVDRSGAEALVGRLNEAYPNLEFELIEGGQPHYPYIISIE